MKAFAALVIVMAASQARAADQAPVFEFKGVRAREMTVPSKFQHCSEIEGLRLACYNDVNSVAGWDADITYRFLGGWLTELYVFISANAYPDVIAALTAKYGAPCRSEPGVWQNLEGAALDNPTSVWCFATGELSISQRGKRADQMRFEYIDTHMPGKAAKVDF